MMRGWTWRGWTVACVALAACGSSSTATTSPPDATVQAAPGSDTSSNVPPSSTPPATTPPANPPPPAVTPPVTKNGWTFYDSGQGLSKTIVDVSADEAGNVYVAGGDALYVKKRDAAAFVRFDAANAGLTRNCYAGVPGENDPGFAAALDGKSHPKPPGDAILCPVISVAGAAPGTAAIGLKGHGTDGDLDADWAQDSGGVDLVAFDGTTVSRTRHVFVASPPGTICGPYPGHPNEERTTSCGDPWEFFWTVGRRKLRQVNRMVVNHDHGSAMYGDLWMGGTHATVAALLDNASSRGLPDRTIGQSDPKWADAKGVWEHDHPAWYDPGTNLFLTNITYALAIQPGSGIPWASNGLRTAYITGGYGPDLHNDGWWLAPQDAAHPLWLDLWPDPGTPSAPTDPLGAADDHVESLSFCDDGTLWIGSSAHGLAIRDPGGSFSGLALPDPAGHGDSVYAVACDPSDHSIWIGLGWGGVMRYRNGSFEPLDPTGMPAFVRQPVRSIQIDRWSSPRRVYFAFIPSQDSTGAVVKPGGVAEYSGP